jgi:hypothetical protein
VEKNGFGIDAVDRRAPVAGFGGFGGECGDSDKEASDQQHESRTSNLHRRGRRDRIRSLERRQRIRHPHDFVQAAGQSEVLLHGRSPLFGPGLIVLPI